MNKRGQVISVVDYGVANLGSIRNMLRKLGYEVELISTPEAVSRATKIILPGVGAFDHGVAALVRHGLMEPLRARAADPSVPFLGICLGMQLLGNGSEEGTQRGLGVLDSSCVRFRLPPGSVLKIPHMGWNEPVFRRAHPLVADLGTDARFYFTHSFHMVCAHPEDVLATVTHGIEFVAMVQCGNVMGVQFHPEKSHRYGMALLRNFGAMRC